LLRLLFATVLLAGLSTATAPASTPSSVASAQAVAYSDGGAPMPLCRPSDPNCKPPIEP